MTILVIAEHDNTELKSDTSRVVACAELIGGDIELLVIGADCQSVAKQASMLLGVKRILVADNPVYQEQLADSCAELILSIAPQYSHILAAATIYGKSLLPIVSAKLDVAQLSDVVEVISDDTFVRPIYAGRALAKIESLDKVKVMTIRTTAFELTKKGGHAPIVALKAIFPSKIQVIANKISARKRVELSDADVIVAGGYGVGSKENFKLLEQLADRLGGAVGGTRAAVDAGYITNQLQIGQTGKVVAPKLYIAAGISGASQHVAGIKGSDVIVAINHDPSAPIFDEADYIFQGDLVAVITELLQQLDE